MITQVLYVIRPHSLEERLERDLSFSHYALRKDFEQFLKHAIKSSKAFRLVDSGPKKKRKRNNDCRSVYPSGKKRKTEYDMGREQPLWLWEAHPKVSVSELLRNCQECLSEEKNFLKSKLLPKKAKWGPQSPPGHKLPSERNL